MALTTYAELQTAVGDWLARADLTSYIPDFITLAEAEINRRLRVRQQESTTDLTVSGQTVALPTGYIGTRRIYLSADPIIKPSYMQPEVFWSTFVDSSTGRPRNFTIEGDNLVFGPAPDETYTGKFLYWKRQDITASAHTLYTQNPDLYLFGSLLQASPFIRNDVRIPMWQQKFEGALASVEMSDQRDRFATGMAMQTTGSTP